MVHASLRKRLITGSTLVALAISPIIAPWSAMAAESTQQGTATAKASVSNLALNDSASISASGTESGTQWQPERAIDGDKGKDFAWRDNPNNFRSPSASRWSSENKNEGWLAVDLGAEANLDHVTITWGKQYGADYVLETSNDGKKWTQAGEIQHGEASKEKETKLSGSARHIRVRFTKRNSTWPVGIWELEVFGTWKGNPPAVPGEGLPSVLPMPVTYESREGDAFVLSPESDIVAPGKAKAEGERLAKTLRASTGYSLDVVDQSPDAVADIELSVEGSRAEEAYTVDVSREELAISASTAHGLFNGCQTTYQLLGPWSTAEYVTNGPWSVPALHIEDQPRFAYRGIMLDPARSFFTKDEVKQAIDILSKYKYSYLHLHLVDDQGWRIEITNDGREAGDTIDYTKLSEIGSKTAMGTTDQQATPGVTGFYTQADMREITAYARDHHIKIVPEIDMPGHSQSMLHCIPQLNTPGSSHNGTVDAQGNAIKDPANYIVAPHQGTGAVGHSYLDPNSNYTWTFLKHVVKQVAELTDAEYFHFGGDETHKLNTDHPGQAKPFLTKAATMVRDMGLKPIGWNEWAIGDMQPGDGIQFWNGDMKQTTNKIKDEGAKGLYSAAANCYFPQKAGEDIWGATWATGIADINDFYSYDPAAKMGATDEQMIGVEAAMWNEHVRGIQDFFLPSFPRAMATAEVGWTPQAKRDGKVKDLRRRIADVLPQLTINHADFYAKDGLVHTPQVAAADLIIPAQQDGNGATVGYGYMPETYTREATASITWDNGVTHPLTVKQEREYKPSNPNNNNNRAQNGIFELSLSQPVPAEAKSATIEFKAGGKTATDTLAITREPAPEPQQKHTVSFDLNGGSSSITSLEVANGDKLPAIATPTMDGHEFAGWFDAATNQAWDMNAPVTSNLTLIARWNKAAMEIAPAPNRPGKPQGNENGNPGNAKPNNPGTNADNKPGALPTTGDPATLVGAIAAIPGLAALAGSALLRKKR